PIQMKDLFVFSLVAIASEPILKQFPRSPAWHFCSTSCHHKFDAVHCYQNLLLAARQRHGCLHLVMRLLASCPQLFRVAPASTWLKLDFGSCQVHATSNLISLL